MESLKRGEAATGGGSAELHYYMGLLAFEQGDKESALAYARKAYGAGYPLPGLKNKLEADGYNVSR
jgi:hypothetical protein